MNKLLALLLLPVAGLALAAGVSFTAKDGWIRSAPPGAQAMAGYATLVNESKESLKIVDASSDAFDSVAFHESYEDEGMMRMRAMTALEVPAEGSVTLAPNGMHLMLMRPKRAISEGESVIIDLLTEEGDSLPLVMKVRRGEDSAEAGADAHDHAHDHH